MKIETYRGKKATLVLEKEDFRTRKIIRDQLSEPVPQEVITILIMYSSTNRILKYEGKNDKIARINRQIHYYSWRLLIR